MGRTENEIKNSLTGLGKSHENLKDLNTSCYHYRYVMHHRILRANHMHTSHEGGEMKSDYMGVKQDMVKIGAHFNVVLPGHTFACSTRRIYNPGRYL